MAANLSDGQRSPPRRPHLSGKRFLPVLPALPPSLLLSRRRSRAMPFPLDCSGAHAAYLARNGVWLAVRALGLVGAEILVPAYHHGVEVEALLAARAIPRFVRVDAEMRLDLEHLEESIGPATRAIYVIHYLGFAQPMEAIMALARKYGLLVIEDCALALLARDGAIPLGSGGDAGIFCLYKSLPVPNGGILVLNRAVEISHTSRAAPLWSTLSHVAGSVLIHAAHRWGPMGTALREDGRRLGRAARRAMKLEVLSTGTSHLDPAALEIGMSGISAFVLKRLDYEAIIARRRRNWSSLSERLRGRIAPIARELPEGACPLFFPLVCEDKRSVSERLASRGVETVDFWSEGHPACPVDAFPEVAFLRRSVLELPLHQDLSDSDMDYLGWAAEEALS